MARLTPPYEISNSVDCAGDDHGKSALSTFTKEGVWQELTAVVTQKEALQHGLHVTLALPLGRGGAGR